MEELARVYARSLFEVAREHDKLELLREQIGSFADALRAHRELAMFFFSPYFSSGDKQQALARVLEDADETFLSFLKLLIEKHRMPVIFRIREEYERLWREHNRELPVVLTSAVELDERTAASVRERIGARTGRKVTLTERVDPDILGGLVVRIGNSILDASLRGRLERLRRQLASAAA
jgi:F-type H+-transporting ATPase subunit delta